MLTLLLALVSSGACGTQRKPQALDDLWLPLERCDILVLDGATLTPEQFRAAVLEPQVPALVRNATSEWRAMREWKLQRLKKKWGRRVAVDWDDDDDSESLRSYMKYLYNNEDDDPYYFFSDVALDADHSPFGKHYEVPDYFTDDYFHYLTEQGVDRPPHRWLLIGPERSGTYWHTDPMNTSAWNALVVGTKRWSLYPPHRVVPGYVGRYARYNMEDTFDEPAHVWYREHLPRLPEAERPLECMQVPGDILFVPGGYWHHVLNLEHSVSVSQNFVDDINLKNVLLEWVNCLHDEYHAKRFEAFIPFVTENFPEVLESAHKLKHYQIPEQFSINEG